MLAESKRLKKELSLFNVYAIATGATLSSGFFLLPGLAAAESGPAISLCYLMAAIPLIPAVFSMAELATAMPRAGGVYYFLDRSMGPYWGTIGGLGTWLVLTLKTAFALIGMGAYISLYLPEVALKPLAIALAVGLGFINLLGAKKSGAFQGFIVVTLLATLAWFSGQGAFNLQREHFAGFFDKDFRTLVGTAGLVYVSYIGITKIASVSEEVKNPDRNVPLGMLLALITAIVIYGVGTTIMVGVLPPEQFYADFTPVASAARTFAGPWGGVIMTIAAILAFFSVTNAAILSASRYPLAMSRDHLLPRFFRYLSKYRTPKVAIFLTVALIVFFLTAFDPTKIAKLASAFQLLLFAFTCVAVIIMRESRIDSYDPGYRSPLYPWMQIFGIIAPFWLIFEMGWLSTAFTIGLIALSTVWYFTYARERVVRDGAIYHIFARLGERRFEGLDRELRGILVEKGAREEDPYDVVIAHATLIDCDQALNYEEIVHQAAEKLAERVSVPAQRLEEGFLQGTKVGATPVSHGVALPHVRLHEIEYPTLVMVRVRKGVHIDIDEEFLGEEEANTPVHALFFVASPDANPGQHLRLLAQIAAHTDDERFIRHWLNARDEPELKELLLRDERFLSLHIKPDSKAAALRDRAIRDLNMPKGSLIALIHRGGEIIFPRGSTILKEGDRLTIIGEPIGIRKLAARYRDGGYADTGELP